MTQYLQDPAVWTLVASVPFAAYAVRSGGKKIASLRSDLAALEELRDGAVSEAQARAEGQTKSVLKASMQTLLGLANEQQILISKLQADIEDTETLKGLLQVDHANAQFARRAKSIAVLCDGWLGRRTQSASLYDVIRSAKGHILKYQRVEIRSQSNLGVVSHAVEPVALAIAELLDNATSYSSPDTTIEINIHPVANGVCINIDDAGVGMADEEKAKAGELLSGNRRPGVSGLGIPPQFGFAVIGELAGRYGFTVSVDSTSPYGGVRAVVLLPSDLLTTIDVEDNPAVASSTPPSSSSDRGTTRSGLPMRRRSTGPVTVVPPRESTDGPGRDSETTAARYGDFQRGTQSGRRSQKSTEGHETQ